MEIDFLWTKKVNQNILNDQIKERKKTRKFHKSSCTYFVIRRKGNCVAIHKLWTENFIKYTSAKEINMGNCSGSVVNNYTHTILHCDGITTEPKKSPWQSSIFNRPTYRMILFFLLLDEYNNNHTKCDLASFLLTALPLLTSM